jgi:hypothetical protein
MKKKKAGKYHKVYFAHSMSAYETPHERKAIKAIERWLVNDYGLPRIEVVNPGDPKIMDAVAVLYPLAGMGLFDAIAVKSLMVFAMPFKDGIYGAGVHSEVAAADRAGRQTFSVDPKTYEINRLDFRAMTALSPNETRARIDAKVL